MRPLCREQTTRRVFIGYAYGDPLPIYARYHGEADSVPVEDAIKVYPECARDAGHPGDHLALDGTRWPK